MSAEGGLIFLAYGLVGIPALIMSRLLLNRLAGRKLFPLWALLLLILGVPLAASMALDAAGTVYTLNVLNKRESFQYSNQFYNTRQWSRHFYVDVEAPTASAENSDGKLALWVDGRTYDAMEVGRPAEVRIVNLGPGFNFARPAQRSAFSWITDWFPPEPRGPWHEATATIQQISEFKIHGTDRSEYRWPYEIVRFRFTRPGRNDVIEALDNIEIASRPDLVENGEVRIRWPEDDPRSARILNARPGAPLLNTIVMLGEYLLITGAFLGASALYNAYRRKRKKIAADGSR